ncbi:uncharacterized protein LOC126677415 [Mercurialis annua]|uniref:uncharacterized protein LOC126677415 n=1 Tax=Mercurialis annua TaxID=3986 RepID=UPI00215F6E7F|nr:uncharacterized protein LOC126677415 [Mercurialis annua]
MFKSARWRNDNKNKIKTVFKLQFHATQVAQLSNVDTLVISVVPGDIGKPTARLDKSIIRDKTCRWEYPVYETVKFTQDSRTGKINDRIYHFIVSTGSSRNGLIGEVSIDLASYAESTKVNTVSLPLKNSKSNAVLHVSIQRLQDNIYRDVEETEDTNIKTPNRSLNSLLSNGDAEEGVKNNSNEDRLPNDASRSSELNGDYRTSSGSDITMSSSDSSSGINTPRELQFRNNSLQDPTSFVSSQSPRLASHRPTVNGSATVREEHQQSQWEWSGESDHGISTDDSINSSQAALTREMSQGTSDIEIEKLKAEIIVLSRQVDLSDLELQTLRKQIVKESKRGQDLTRELKGSKQERDALKAECDKLKAFQRRSEDSKSKPKSQFDGGDPRALLDEIRQELNHEKELNANLRLQLQKTQEANAELILAVTDLEAMLEQKKGDIADPPNKPKSSENPTFRSESDDDEEQKALEELVKEHKDAKEAYLLEQKVMDLSNEIEIYRRDRDEIEMQMEQLALDYEILKQENHDMSYKLEQCELEENLKMQCEFSSSFSNISELESHIESLEIELKKQSEEHSNSLVVINELKSQIESLENNLKKQTREHSDSLVTVNELEAHIKSLEDELEKQSEEFEADLEALTRAKVEEEQRAIRAEDALRKTRWKNADTAEKIQEEFKRLSVQMASAFDANENVAMKALAEANELRIQKNQLEEMLQKANEEIQSVKDYYEAKIQDISDQLNMKVTQIEQMMMEIDDKSRKMEHQKKNEEDLNGSFSKEILRLKGEIKNLTLENNILSKQAEQKENLQVELQQLKSSFKHSENLVQKGKIERNELASTLALAKKEMEKLMKELNVIESLKDEKEIAIDLLQTEVETLKAQCDELKHTLSEDESENEKLRKQVFQLKGEIKKKEDTITIIDKKLKESNKRTAISDSTKNNLRNKSSPVLNGSKEAANLKEKIKLLESRIKLKETALETSENSFSEKERDLLSKIEELEDRLEELNQHNAILHDNLCQKLPEDTIGIISNGGSVEEIGNELLSELESLKEQNLSMENELKEMQERYSEISLKFAEVEGERQQLVMTVRNLKNAKKG